MSKAGWAIYSVLGLAAWMGATVFVAATNADPSDAGPILRTFAIGGALFSGLALAGGGLEVRGKLRRANLNLYRRLAIREVPQQTVRAAHRRTTSLSYTYLIFGGLATGLFFAGIGVAPDGPYAVLTFAAAVVIVVWIGFVPFALRRTFGSAGDLLAPLGLTVAGIPSWRSHGYGGGGELAGALTVSGERFGRQVSIAQTGRLAVTTVRGQFRKRSIGSGNTMASMTGEPARCWRNVRARADDDGVEVRRTGNGAGRWYLYDLLLAEQLAAQSTHAQPDRLG